MQTLSELKEKRMQVDFDNPLPAYPREVIIDITSGCNHKCFFCSNQLIPSGRYINKNLVFRIAREAKEMGATDMSLYGTGEPFLHKDLAEMTRYVKQEVKINYLFLSTNGALATPEKAKPVLDAGIDSIKFSINAGTRKSYMRVHGRDDFEKVITNLKWFSDYRKTSGLKYRLYVSMVINSKAPNEDQILKELISPYIDEFDARGCSNQGGNMYTNNETEHIDKDNLLGSLKKHQYRTNKCPDMFFRMVITPEGYATACVVDYQKYLILGDLNKASMRQVWDSEDYVSFRKRHMANELNGLICDNCLNNTNKPCQPLSTKFFPDGKYKK